MQALSPFKYALSSFSLVIFDDEYFIGEGGERVSGDDVSSEMAENFRNLKIGRVYAFEGPNESAYPIAFAFSQFLKGTFGIKREACASDLGALVALIIV